MRKNVHGVFGSRVAVAITSVIVTTVVIAGGIAAASVPNNSVNSAKIRNGSVQGIDIRNGTITAADLANNSVTSAKIRNGTITAADLAPGSSNVRSASQSGSGLGIVGNGGNQIIRTVSLTTPAAGQLLITGSFSMTGQPTAGTCSVVLNGMGLASSVRAFPSANPPMPCSTNEGVSVGAGAVTVELHSSGISPMTTVANASLQVLFVPTP